MGCQWVADKLKIDELLSIGLSAIALFGLMVVFEIRLFGFQFLSYYFLFYTLGYCIHRFSWLQIKNNVLVLGLFILHGLVLEYARVAIVDASNSVRANLVTTVCLQRFDCCGGAIGYLRSFS